MRTIILGAALALTACGGTAQDATQSSEAQSAPDDEIIGWCDLKAAGRLSTTLNDEVTNAMCTKACAGPLEAGTVLPSTLYCAAMWPF